MIKSERERIDPGDQYPADGLRQGEENALKLLEMVPGAEFTDRTRDVIQLGVPTGIEEDDRIVILVTAEAFEIRLPTVEWTMGAYGPALTSKLWRRPRVSVGLPAVADLIQGAIEVRWKQFRVCKYCGERFPPEHRHGNVCHGCAEKHQGIVH